MAAFCFRHEPQREQELVCLFIALLDDIDELERPVIVETVRESYPDCVIRTGGVRLRVEFKLYGEQFNHPPDGCELLVCWRDHRQVKGPHRVIQLAEVASKRPGLIMSLDEGYPAPWTEERFFAAMQQYGTAPADIEVARHVVGRVGQHQLSVVWSTKPRPFFTVRGSHNCFSVKANGELRLSLGSIPRSDRAEVVDRLKRFVPAWNLTLRDVRAKNNGGQLSELFPEKSGLDAFLSIWRGLTGSSKGPTNP